MVPFQQSSLVGHTRDLYKKGWLWYSPHNWGASITIWVFPKIGVPQNGWFIMENPIKMDHLGGKPTILGNTHILSRNPWLEIHFFFAHKKIRLLGYNFLCLASCHKFEFTLYKNEEFLPGWKLMGQGGKTTFPLIKNGPFSRGHSFIFSGTWFYKTSRNLPQCL